MRGKAGEVVATDGRQLLVQSAFRFGWDGDLLIPAAPIFGCKELPQQELPEAAARLSRTPAYNAQLRTTCVATMLEGGHAYNALPQTASAVVNCRILPGVPVEEVRQTLVRVLADEQISVTPVADRTLMVV